MSRTPQKASPLFPPFLYVRKETGDDEVYYLTFDTLEEAALQYDPTIIATYALQSKHKVTMHAHAEPYPAGAGFTA